MLKSYGWVGWGGGPLDFSVSPSPLVPDWAFELGLTGLGLGLGGLGTKGLDLGLGLDNNIIQMG